MSSTTAIAVFAQNVNVSISETIGRSLNTSLTLLIVLTALFPVRRSYAQRFLASVCLLV